LGNPTGCHLTPGQARDLEGADVLLPDTQASAVRADKAYDAQERGIAPLESAGKGVVIPSSRSRKKPRDYDRHLYQTRHLIENFLTSRSSTAPSPLVMTKPLATFSRQSIWPQQSFGSIDDTA
jgi:transposase